ncbi:MAG TPA: 4Fe-4S dicluster-binding protein [Clostridiaceae bacterium]|nr:4Fe-4S dicluster-binding protein [Clostridiaceae bacterium]
MASIVKSKRVAEVIQNGCVGCGSCTKSCPRSAVDVPKGICAVVDSAACVGCGLCQKACPASVIEIKARVIEGESEAA